MLKSLRPAIALVALFTILTGLLYPLAMTGLAKVFFPHQAEGSLVTVNGTVVGSSLIGQYFASPRYFHGRPSATMGADPADASKSVAAPYNASSSGGSNLGPANPALTDRIKADQAVLTASNPGTTVPIDLVTTSGSGLDPDISPDGARFQVSRVAAARGLDPAKVAALVESHIDHRLFGIIGEPRVNVLALNLDLDKLSGG